MKIIKKIRNSFIVVMTLAFAATIFAQGNLHAEWLPDAITEVNLNTLSKENFSVTDVLSTIESRKADFVKAFAIQTNINLESVLMETLNEKFELAKTPAGRDLKGSSILDGFVTQFEKEVLKKHLLTSKVSLRNAVIHFFDLDAECKALQEKYDFAVENMDTDKGKEILAPYVAINYSFNALSNMGDVLIDKRDELGNAWYELQRQFNLATDSNMDIVMFEGKPARIPSEYIITKHVQGKSTLVPNHTIHKIIVKESFGKHNKIAGKGNVKNNYKLKLANRGFHYHGNIRVWVRGKIVKLSGVKSDKHYKIKRIKVLKDKSGNYIVTIIVAKS